MVSCEFVSAASAVVAFGSSAIALVTYRLLSGRGVSTWTGRRVFGVALLGNVVGMIIVGWLEGGRCADGDVIVMLAPLMSACIAFVIGLARMFRGALEDRGSSRTLLAILLAIAILVWWRLWLAPRMGLVR